MMVYYDSRDRACKEPFGALAAGEPASFTLGLSKWARPDSVVLRVWEVDRWDSAEELPMAFAGGDMVYNYYTCAYTPDAPALRAYLFACRAGEGETEIRRDRDGNACVGGGDLWQLTVYDGAMATPACLGEGIMYQIFPDRFRCSGLPKKEVPEDRLLREDWGGIPHWRPNDLGKVTNNDYFGGDLAGITASLDYIASLGVTCIYLNPIFEAHSNHRYNTADYRNVDPLLGTNEDFHTLCREAKARNIHIILDGVFSHTGSDSIYFNREGRYDVVGACQSTESPYYPWYRFYSHPHHYGSWWGFETLPNVQETEPSYLDFICGEKGVLQHWLELGAGGFRLDVVDELPDEFLDALRARVKAVNPDAAVIGEVWEDASNKVSYGQRRRYLLGKQLDSVMNYPYKDAVLDYVRRGSGKEFYGAVMSILEHYPQPVIPALMNSLSTHDTARAITVLGGEVLGEYGREWQEAHHTLTTEQYRLGKRRFLLASILQFGLPGIPCVYYGDEAGLCGYKDPFNRVCYPWGEEDGEILEGIRRLGQIRSRYPVFGKAEFVPLVFADTLCVFLRDWGEGRLLFAVNRTDTPQKPNLPFDEAGEPLFVWGGWDGETLEPYSGVVLGWFSTKSTPDCG